MTLGLLLQTEDLIAERRAVRVADIAAATQAAMQTLERLQAVAAALGAQATGPVATAAAVSHTVNAATAAVAAADTVDTTDIQQQLLAASGSLAGGGGGAGALPPLVSGDTAAPSEPMLGPGLAAVRLGDDGVADSRMVACDKATDILVRKLAEKERAIAQQYRAAARQAIAGMQEDVLRALARHGDLRPDPFLARLRRILPSEYLAAWSLWTGIFSLLDASNDVMFAMWALYSALALGYVYMRLVNDRAAKDAVDGAALPRDVPPLAAGGAAAGGRGVTGGLRTVAVKADALTVVPSGVEAVSVSHFSQKPGTAAADAALDTASDEEGSASDADSTDEEDKRGRRFGRRRWRAADAGKGSGGGSVRARRSPGALHLFLQALVSAVAFLLLSAFAAGIHTTIGAPVWVFFAPVAPFVLFAQFALPDGLISR